MKKTKRIKTKKKASIRESLYHQQYGLCHWCKRQMIFVLGDRLSVTIDHVIPRYRGGSNLLRNLVAACQECNHRRGKIDQPVTTPSIVIKQKLFRQQSGRCFCCKVLMDYSSEKLTSIQIYQKQKFQVGICGKCKSEDVMAEMFDPVNPFDGI